MPIKKKHGLMNYILDNIERQEVNEINEYIEQIDEVIDDYQAKINQLDDCIKECGIIYEIEDSEEFAQYEAEEDDQSHEMAGTEFLSSKSIKWAYCEMGDD